jgi:hypothetical protein
MQQHFVHSDLTGILLTKSNHGQTVASKYHVHACVIGDMGAGEVVGGDHGNWLVFAVH